MLPKISDRKFSTTPKFLTEDQLHSLLTSYNLSNAIGLRDQAMAYLMARLGLRCGEVANLKLENIDWRKGVVELKKTKSHRDSSLSLSKEVGNILVDYITKGRPQTKERYVFVTHKTPTGKPLSIQAISTTVNKALKRVNLKDQFSGSHILRHSIATHLLQRGASIKEIADILRHRDINTTNIYTKVDFKQLEDVVLPWPEKGDYDYEG